MIYLRICLVFLSINSILNFQQQENDDLIVNPIDYHNLTFQPLYNFQSNYTDFPNITIFKATALSITKLYFDPRHLYPYSQNQQQQTYEFAEGWNIIITQDSNLNEDTYLNLTQQFSSRIPLPQGFTSNQTDKFSNFEFKLFALQDLQTLTQIQINNTLFYSNKMEMISITKISNTIPQRAQFGQNKVFVCIQTTDDAAILPMNPFPLQSDSSNSPFIFDYRSAKKGQALTQQQQIQNVNVFSNPNSYWGSRSKVLLPYLPFFSNCQNYGHYIFLQELLESDQCNLIPLEQTVPINPFLFGGVSKSDSCSNLTIQCILDEPYDTSQSYWYVLQTGQIIFQLYQIPLSDLDIVNQNLDPQLQIPVILLNQIPSGKMASEIVLSFYYYQETKTDKKIIQATLQFQNYYVVTANQQTGVDPLTYNLIFNFIPMGQSALVNAFALDWPVYLILYIGIGALSTSEISIFLLYHYIFNREKRPELKFFQYFRVVQPQQFKGVVLAALPLFTLFIAIGIIMNGQIWHYDLQYACLLGPATQNDSKCAVVLFDLIKNGMEYSDSAFNNLRFGRTGMTFIICGFYTLISVSRLYLVVENNQTSKQKWKNGNIWDYKKWRTTTFLLVSFLVCIALVVMIQFSFSTLFSIYWIYFLVLFKLAFIISEYFLDKIFENSLMVAPLVGIMGLILNIATMGAPNFYQFLFSYFIDIGMQMYERAYISKVQTVLISYIEGLVEKLTKLLKRIFDDEEEESDNEEENEIQKNQVDIEEDTAYFNKSSDSDDDEIIFPNEYQENLVSDDDSFASEILNKAVLKISKNLEQEQLEFVENDDYFEEQFRNRYNDVKKSRLKIQVKLEEDEIIKKAISFEITTKRMKMDDLISSFQNFQLDAVTLYFYPFYIGIMWSFYDSSYWANNYMISYNNLIFYFLWSIIIIPFQLTIDVMFYNVIEQYHGLSFLDYIHQIQDRFIRRKTAWKKFEWYQNFHLIETALQPADQTCFSPQYYFLISMGLTSQFMMIMGFHMIYWNSYDMFSDQALILIIVFWISVCYLIERLSIWIAIKLENVINSEPSYSSQIEPNSVNENNISVPQQVTHELRIPNWSKVVENIEKAVQIEEINEQLIQGDYTQQTFRDLFLQNNKVWLVDHLEEIFSPKTIKFKRAIIIKNFEKIYGKHEKQLEQPKEEVFEEQRATPKKEILKNNSFTGKITPSAVRIIQYWLNRKNHMKRAKRLVGGILELQTKSFCLNCGMNWGLSCTSEKLIEDIYLEFLKENDLFNVQTLHEIDAWQNYFLNKSNPTTICLICNEFMVDLQMKQIQNTQQHQETLEQIKSKKRRRHIIRIFRGLYYWIVFYKEKRFLFGVQDDV